jgi:Asp-tRNA(Asn)/Glu-tRNA(Gln) amidotransferase A subunit family amidase
MFAFVLNLFNLTGHPAISVPIGFTRSGLPVGLQLVGRWNSDAQLLGLADRLMQCVDLRAHRPPILV